MRMTAAGSIHLCRAKWQVWLHCVLESSLCACRALAANGERLNDGKPWTACRAILDTERRIR